MNPRTDHFRSILTATRAPCLKVRDKNGLLIEAPGHTDSSFLGNECGELDPSSQIAVSAHITRQHEGDVEPCAECTQFLDLVHMCLAKKPATDDTDTPMPDFNAPPPVPRSLASVAQEEDDRFRLARQAWIASKVRQAPTPAPKATRRQDDINDASSTTLQDWATYASHADMYATLLRNDHLSWFLNLCSTWNLRDYILNHRCSLNWRKEVVPDDAKKEWKILKDKAKTENLKFEVGTYNNTDDDEGVDGTPKRVPVQIVAAELRRLFNHSADMNRAYMDSMTWLPLFRNRRGQDVEHLE
ncbi:hypothetical protein EJ02DRAFT_426377 [Clathrospora elynae]|uniref:Uncharacterized protein n=1 Tax=Clathrospora elynae TaxID=706981 RepID=A0A6A5SK43_9PLEO|nr:hypothetical protein EJ02DRAFT_426377 [Clathrospora elynae]